MARYLKGSCDSFVSEIQTNLNSAKQKIQEEFDDINFFDAGTVNASVVLYCASHWFEELQKQTWRIWISVFINNKDGATLPGI